MLKKETVHHVLFSMRDQKVKRQQQHAGCFCTYGAAGWTHRCLFNHLSSAEGKGEDLQPWPSGLHTQDSASLSNIQGTEEDLRWKDLRWKDLPGETVAQKVK